MRDTLWFAPLETADGALHSVYDADPGSEVASAGMFTVRIEAVKLASVPKEPIFKKLLHPSHDVLILSSSALGAKPLVDRVHYYKQNIDLERGVFLRDILSDTVCVCDDYQERDTLYVELKVVTIDTSDQHRAAVLKAFETLAGSAGAAFPVVLPYTAIGDEILESLTKLWDALSQRETWRITEPIKLMPPRTSHAKTIRTGRYVVFSEEVDGTTYQLGEGCELQGDVADHLSFVIMRIDPAEEIAMDYVVSQRVATLLTQIKNDQDGQPASLQTSFGFLTDTLTAWTNFTDLQRYHALATKAGRTSAEDNQMRYIARRPELQPFLPKA